MSQYLTKINQDRKNTLVFIIFSFWSFILLTRPQDIFPFLETMRPALILSLLTFFVFMLTKRSSILKMSINNGQVKLYSILIVIMALSIPFALYRRGAFMFLFTQYISVILFFFIFFNVVDSPKKITTILFMCCLGAGFYSIFAIIQGDLEKSRLSFGSMYDPNDLVFFALSFFPFNFIFLSKDNFFLKRLICIGNLVFGVLLILMTGSRGGVIAFFIVILMLLLTKNFTIKLLYKVLFVILCLVAVSINISKINIERYQTIGSIKEDYNVTDETGRLEIWENGLKIMLSRPLTGVGINCFNEAIGADREERGLLPIWQTAHNSLIQIGAETGVAGFIIFAIISFKAFRIFWKVRGGTDTKELVKIAEMARIGFVGQFITAMFLSQAYSVYWAFYIVLSAVLYRFLNNKTETNKDPNQPALL